MRIRIGNTYIEFNINAAKMMEFEWEDADVSSAKLDVSLHENISSEDTNVMMITLSDRDMHNIICAYNNRRTIRRR